MKEKLFKKLEANFDEMVRLRRHFHMYPELSFEEVETAKYIADYQEQLGLEVRRHVGGNGVVAKLIGGKPGKTVAIRADFDALPIEEKNDVPYKSKHEGVMHACGHDAHTAIALGISKVLSEVKDELEGDVLFIHQHAEEKDPGGAKLMIEDGALKDGVDVIFATHMENYIPINHIWHSDDYVLSSADDFTIEIIGDGGHAAFPHETVDVIAVGSQLVNNLQQIISRKKDPLRSAILTLGAFQAGDEPNVIPERATLKGTVRTFDEEVRKEIYELIEQMTKYTCKTFGAEYELDYRYGCPSTKNNESINQLLVHAAEDVIPKENIVELEPNLGAEDFAFFLEEVPGVYFFTGSANEEKGFIYPYHHPKFDIDEDALLIGAKILTAATLDYWKQYNES